MQREDYLIRLIKQVAEFVGRIAGHTKRLEFAAAIDEANRAWTDLFDVPRELVDRLDGPTLASMLREPDKMRCAAELLAEEAKAYAGTRDPAHAALCYRRAFELYLEARALDPRDSDDAAIFELSRLVPPSEIDPRYRPA
ncbi:MAG TPA: hypothetical protein VGF94_01190 [Kofleriaceae bacterium]